MPRRPPTHLQSLRRGRARPPEHRPSAAARGYDHDWRRLRAWKLRRDPLCEECLGDTPPRIVEATEVDHVVPLSRGGERLALKKLRSLCKSCHSRKTGRERGRGGASL